MGNSSECKGAITNGMADNRRSWPGDLPCGRGGDARLFGGDAGLCVDTSDSKKYS